MRKDLILVLCGGLVLAGCGAPTGPDDYVEHRSGVIFLTPSCAGNGSGPLACTAFTSCTGYCSAADTASLRDMTAQATWIVTGSALRYVGGGRFEAAGTGYASVRAEVPGTALATYDVAVGVFPGQQPVPVFRAQGQVGYGQLISGPLGTLPRIDRPLDGVTVEVIDGPAAGQWAVTGLAGAPLPGLSPQVGPGAFALLGLPNQPFTIEVRVPGKPLQRLEVAGPNTTSIVLVPE